MSTANWQGRDQGIPPVVPIGSMFMWATNTAPQDYLICNGQAVSRTQYTSLFAILGTTYGAGDGSTTFNIPNAGGRTIRGAGGTYALASTGGADTVMLAATNLPNHSHTYFDPKHSHTYTLYGAFGSSGLINGPDDPQKGEFAQPTTSELTNINITDSLLTGASGATPGTQVTQVATNIVNPYLAVNYIIKAN